MQQSRNRFIHKEIKPMASSGWEGVIGQKDQGVQTTRLKINKKKKKKKKQVNKIQGCNI